MALIRRAAVVTGTVAAALASVAPCTLRAQGATDARAAQVLIREADSLFNADNYGAALARYEAAMRADSTASRAVYRVAVLRSWRDELDIAIALHRRYVELEPRDDDGRVGLARVLSWAGQYAASVALYDTVIGRNAGHRDAVMGRASTLASWGRFAEADSAYAAWTATHAADTAAMLERARRLAWAGRYDEALTLYRRAGPASVEGQKGEARVLTWKGDLVGGEAQWESLAQRYPNDVDVWVGLGQVRRWRGNPRGSRVALDRALRLRPGQTYALEQRRWIDAELDAAGGVTISATHDSDDNDAFTVAVHGGLPVPVGQRVEATASMRRATLGALDGHAVSAQLNWGVQSNGGKTSALFGAGVTSLSASALPGGSAPEATLVFGSARVRAQLGTGVFAGIGASRTPLDEVTATIRTGVVLDLGDADVTVRLPHRVSAGIAAHGGSVARGEDGANDRWGMSGSVGWAYRRNITFAARTRAFGYERPATDGYFSPQRFQLTELAAGWQKAESYGWQAGVDVAAGSQRIRVSGSEPATRNAWSAAAFGGFRWRPGVESSVKAIFANVASPATVFGDAEYRYTAMIATVRWLF